MTAKKMENLQDCRSIFDCCDCGGEGCGCSACYSCNVCKSCEEDSNDKINSNCEHKNWND